MEQARTQKNDTKSKKETRKYRLGVETLALMAAFILSVIGIGITDFYPMASYRYWGAMTLILATIGIVLGWAHQKKLNLPVRELFITQMVHWGATMAAIAGVFFLLKAGRLNYENTGLVVLLILALATFLDGYRFSWSFSVLGMMMFISAVIGAYIEQYAWVVLIAIVCTAVAIIVLEKYRIATMAQSSQRVSE